MSRWSLALGSAQKLQNGNYHWNAGLNFDPASPVNPTAARRKRNRPVRVVPFQQ